MQFKYSSETWCHGGMIRREEPKDALGKQG